jgi:crotonobetainyl-CoA:carnitine CoA-transferase CaiB-like acyl-CoA transferase
VDVVILQGEEPRITDEELAEVRRANPDLVLGVMRPFGLSGPYRDYRAEGLNLFEVGGSGYLVPAGLAYFRKPDGQPLNLPGHTSEAYTGLVAAIAIVSAWYARPEAGGQLIDCSQQEAHLSISRQQLTWYANDGAFEARETYHTAFGGCVPCKDGYVQIYVMNDGQWQALKEVLDHPSWMDDEDLSAGEARIRRASEIQTHLLEWAAERSKTEIYQKAQRANCPIAFYATPAEVCASPHEYAREFFISADHPVAGRLPYALSSFKLSQTPQRISRGAPLLGEHNGEVYGDLLGLKPAQMTLLSRIGAI